MFTSSVANTLWAPAGPAYVQLANQFHASVDDVASAFTANTLGLAALTYVAAHLSEKV